MAIETFSAFYYGHAVTSSNWSINFKEGAGAELEAQVAIGSYTLTEFLIAVKTALDAEGALTYTISVDRDTRLITIAATGTFSLLVSTGSQVGTGLWDLLGFSGSDKTGTNTYTASAASGYEYLNQFKLQDFVDSEDFQEKIDPTVLESASGSVEVVNFGTRKLYEMSFKYITNLAGDGRVIKNNPTGLNDARDFFQYITQKKPFEFMPSVATRSAYRKLILESTSTASDGTGYKLVELVGQGSPGYYEINNVRMRDLT